jgi:hypothetical protein
VLDLCPGLENPAYPICLLILTPEDRRDIPVPHISFAYQLIGQ